LKFRAGLLGSAAILCAFSLVCKGSGMLFRLYLSNRMGSEGIGLYQLILSVYALFASFATAGFGVSVSKIAAEEFERGGLKGAAKSLNTAARLALGLGVVSMLSLLILSGPLSGILAGGPKTLAPLRILSLSMPFMALSSCVKGYFIASRRVIIPASSQLFEELCKIGLNLIIISLFLQNSMDSGSFCIGIAVGLTGGEVFSLIYVWGFWLFGKRYRFSKKESKFYPVGRITTVILPNAASSWLTSGLHAAENILIPYCFTLYGGGESKALSDFGLIRGMAIPVLFFPFAFLSALISILIPEISRLNTFTDKTARDAKMQKTLRVSFIFGFAAGGVFFFLPREISLAFYHSDSAATAFRLLATVTPFMYVETIMDGLLKGIGEQAFTMRATLYNCALRIISVLVFLPSTGAYGYLWILIVSNTFSFAIYLWRILKVSGVRIGFTKHVFSPVLCVIAAGFGTRRFLGFAGIVSPSLSAGAGSVLFAALYFLLFLAVSKLGSGKSV